MTLTTPLLTLAVAFVLCALGVVVLLIAPERKIPAILGWAGSLAAIAVACAGALSLAGPTGTVGGPLWEYPGIGTISLQVDRLAGFFLCITGAVYLPGVWTAASQLDGRRGRLGRRWFSILLLALLAAMAAILVSGDVFSFFVTWEAMALLSYLLLQLRPGHRARHAAYLWLALSEAGVLIAMVAFLLLASHANAIDFSALRAAAAHLPPAQRTAIFLLGLLGFGVKAGLVPGNVWLPRVYTEAPSAFAPILAGATLNLGFYGILRLGVDLAGVPPAGAGAVALVIGVISALIGILYATTANDMRAVLAHSSVENAGVTVAAIGAAIVFKSSGLPIPAAIALVAGLYHLVGHSLVKTLLFAGVGGVEDATGLRDLDRLGGLIKGMPVAAFFILIGCLSLSALPPFSGFVSEWLILQSLLRSALLQSLGMRLLVALCGAGLALAAGLAVTCFVKFFAMGFLGMARSRATEMKTQRRSLEPGRGTQAALAVLALGTVALGIMPTYVLPELSHVGETLLGVSAAEAIVPPFFAPQTAHPPLPVSFVADFHSIGAQVGQGILPGRGLVVLLRGGSANPVVFAMSTSYMAVVLAVMLLIAFLVVRFALARDRAVTRKERWDGGIRRLLADMTYSATGFSNPVRVVFDAVFRPTTIEDTSLTVAEHFQTGISRLRVEEHLVDRLVFAPILAACRGIAAWLARLHHGRVGGYAAYGLGLLVLVLLIAQLQGVR